MGLQEDMDAAHESRLKELGIVEDDDDFLTEPTDPSIWKDVVGRCKVCGNILKYSSLMDSVVDALEEGAMYKSAYNDLWAAVRDWINADGLDRVEALADIQAVWESGEKSDK